LPDGSLGPETKLPEAINQPGYTSTQPNVAFDEELGQEVLFFVSDRPGSTGDDTGDLDIWYSPMEGLDNFSSPVFLSEVNTLGDDMTPFYHSNSKVLYFSSDGYQSLGGLDIYRSERSANGYSQPRNMGLPYNSTQNDLYYALSADGQKGILSSSRDSALYIDALNESCCYDLFEVDLSEKRIELNVITTDCRSLDSLVGATVSLFDSESGELVSMVYSEESAQHSFRLKPDKNYMIVSKREGYFSDTTTLNTTRVNGSRSITRRICLKPMGLTLQVLVFDSITREPLPGATVHLTSTIGSFSLDTTMTNIGGNDFEFGVISGQSYRIEASKPSVYDTVRLDLTAADLSGTGIQVKRIYLPRDPITLCFPLAVYFDNDIPVRGRELLNTNVSYTETFDNYIFRKQEFIDEYTDGLLPQDIQNAESEVREFFDEELKEGFDNLQTCFEVLLDELKKGRKFDFSIRGFTSPLAASRYNLALGQRRVKAVLNELNQFQRGAFVEFIQAGDLKITELSYGENLAPSGISDRISDKKGSIYSPDASRERRVEIVEIISQNLND
jgi:hypothetical protein